jgi:hypothetical protein
MATEGGDLWIYNHTPYDWTLRDEHSYQVSWGTYGHFPQVIPANSCCRVHIEWEVFWVCESDDRAHATYYVEAGDRTYLISFRGDKDSGSFNIWVDLYGGIGNIPMEPYVTRKDLGWVHNGSVSFSLYYNDELKKFSLSSPSPIEYTGTMQVGYYALDIGIFEHTYCIMTQNDINKVAKFYCSGGIDGNKNVFPASFYSQDEKERGKGPIPCNSAVARVLAAWDENIEWDREKYNRTTDYAGIHYGIDGVCHQICNTILCATNPEHPMSAYVNWPDSFDISRFFFGIRGDAYRRDQAIQELVNVAKNLNKGVDAKKVLAPVIAETRKIMLGDLQDYLYGKSLEEHRKTLIWQNIKAANGSLPDDKIGKLVSEILPVDMKLSIEKLDLDNQIIRGSVPKEEYAKNVNHELVELNNRYSELSISPEIKPIDEKGQLHVINPDFIPDYKDLRNYLGL